MFFLRDGANDPLYLEDLFRIFSRALTVFNEEQIEGIVVSK